ncbi:putative MFS-type transporter YfcJ [Rhizobium rhizogenes]|uniref:MFS-type transporter YfcJ n=1 Tax=Rhizobium rhizogenes TaxID=359 RepID=A0AAN2A3G8_RHIRH|nr:MULTISPECIES: MFS transporter [Rhizobium/Agrobacterium group]AQS61878.1 MFS transporter [Rhizobium rhizogenes]MCZ7442887.1 MFS transporter [Rhizobium rhizogenes]NSZ78877.1 MFS transporter [Agrobacterium tumefaciens]OAM65679.1 MFS transporter [Rhizobium rhizogenes]CAD0211090.1 putative MFS-type transporter YfcJ [Rhizobium rhizogenes]
MTTSSAPVSAAVRARIPPTVWVLGFVSLLMDISSEMVQTLLPYYLVSGLGASAVTVGFIEGLSVAIATTTKLFSGIIADWTRRRKMLAVLGYGLGAISKLAFPFATSLGWIVAAKAMDRVGKGIRGTPRDALIADVTPAEIRGAAFGLRKSLDTVGGFIGPLAAMALMFALSENVLAIFWIAVIPAFLSVFILMIGVKEPDAPAQTKAEKPFRAADFAKLNPAVWIVIFGASLLTFARFSEAFLLLKSEEAGFRPAWIPVTMIIMHAVYGLTAYPAGRLSDRIGRSGILAASVAVLAASYLALAFANSIPLFLTGILLWGLHMGLSQGLLATLVAETAPPNLKGTAFGVFNLMTGVAVLIGNVLAGLLWDLHGSFGTFLMGAILSLAALPVLIWISRRRSAPAG